MSSSPSDTDAVAGDAGDPLRPSDHADTPVAASGPDNIALGPLEWVRWAWRQLTSMRTALVLLLLLAIAAVPGSIVPQRSADPNGVTQYFTSNPDIAPVLDNLSLFDVYTSPWFSAIYILLFVSLIGCVIPRTRHHWKALRSRPPRTPARLSRLDDHEEAVIQVAPGEDAGAAAAAMVDLAAIQLRAGGYRVERYDDARAFSVSAERGYLRETGNLVFHGALVGVLVAVGVGGGFTYTGQDVLVEGQGFVNTLADYSSFNPGRFVDTEALPPYALTLDEFSVAYVPAPSGWQAGDYVAHLTTRVPGGEPQDGEVRVNHPLDMEGDRIYLMGNGYAPTLTVRNAAGDVVFRDSVPFLPQDANLTSLGVVKVTDGLPQQVGLLGFFYPTADSLASGALTSIMPDLFLPTMTLDVYVGDLGIDRGAPVSVYTLDPTDMTQLTGRAIDVPSLRLEPGDTVDLPDGMGTVTFENESPAETAASDFSKSVKRFASLSVHRDVGAPWVLGFAVLSLTGLLAALFVPRRRMWVRARADGDVVRVEYAGLARGEDPTLAAAVSAVARDHRAGVDAAGLGDPERPASS